MEKQLVILVFILLQKNDAQGSTLGEYDPDDNMKNDAQGSTLGEYNPDDNMITIKDEILEHILDLLREVVMSNKPQSKFIGLGGEEKIFCLESVRIKYETCREICRTKSFMSFMICKSVMLTRYLGGCLTGNIECIDDTGVTTPMPETTTKDPRENPEICSEWSYPSDNWPTICPYSCDGTRQSPIDIDNTGTNVESENFTYVNYNQAISTINIKNNGHSVSISWDTSVNTPSISGGGLEADYTLAQFHFHWGCENSRGSEHTVSKGSYAMEMHLVHYKTSYGSLEKAIKYIDGLAVLGVLFLIGAENTALKPITDNLLQITEPGTEADIAFNVALVNFLPSNHQTFYRYQGSLTTPTCNEVVIWSVLQFDVELSQSQIDAFRSMKDHHDSSICDNYRDVQPLNGRNVALYNPGLSRNLLSVLQSEAFREI